MRERCTRTFLAVSATAAVTVGVGLTMVPAAAVATARSGGPVIAGPIGTYDLAGYQASGRQFRWISATITVPDMSPAFTVSPSGFGALAIESPRTIGSIWPAAYIQLSNGSLPNYLPGHSAGGQYARAGIEPCARANDTLRSENIDGISCQADEWIAFIEVFRNSLSSSPRFRHFEPLTGVSPGSGVAFSIYLDQGGNELFFTITLPGASPLEFQTGAHGAIFNYAAALVDFANTAGSPVPLQQWTRTFNINDFLQGAITTVNGQKGSFVGPWTTSLVEATSNGLPYPAGTVRVSPGPLASDGLIANGAIRPWDAFGVFARH